jgi:hypothetical protein
VSKGVTARRRKMVQDAFRTPDVPNLSNNEVARLLPVGVDLVRAIRRSMERAGEIPVVNYRVARHGNLVDVTRVSHPPWSKASGVAL